MHVNFTVGGREGEGIICIDFSGPSPYNSFLSREKLNRNLGIITSSLGCLDIQFVDRFLCPGRGSMECDCWLVQYVKPECAFQGSIALGILRIANLKRKKCQEKTFRNHFCLGVV